MNDLNHLEQLVARAARGRHDMPGNLDLMWLAMGRDPFGDTERTLYGYLEDPDVDEVLAPNGN